MNPLTRYHLACSAVQCAWAAYKLATPEMRPECYRLYEAAVAVRNDAFYGMDRELEMESAR